MLNSQFSTTLFLLFRTALCIGVLASCSFPQPLKKTVSAQPCIVKVWTSIDPAIDSLLNNGFSRSLTQILAQKFQNINLCVDPDSGGRTDLPVLKLRIRYKHSQETNNGHDELFVTSQNSVRSANNHLTKITQQIDTQFITSIQIPQAGELSGFYLVAAEKIVENIRQEALCEVKISTKPSEAQFSIDSTISGTSPKTMLLPPGSYRFSTSFPGYLPYSTSLEVQAASITKFDCTLKKRRFYHSRFMTFVELFGIAAAASFAAESYFHDQYHRLGKQDFLSDPDKFKRTFNRAKGCEYAGYTLLGMTGSALVLTFLFH